MDLSSRGLVSKDTSLAILRDIFPNYPELTPCNPLPEWAKEENLWTMRNRWSQADHAEWKRLHT